LVRRVQGLGWIGLELREGISCCLQAAKEEDDAVHVPVLLAPTRLHLTLPPPLGAVNRQRRLAYWTVNGDCSRTVEDKCPVVGVAAHTWQLADQQLQQLGTSVCWREPTTCLA
jgi:hypothetical protein